MAWDKLFASTIEQSELQGTTQGTTQGAFEGTTQGTTQGALESTTQGTTQGALEGTIPRTFEGTTQGEMFAKPMEALALEPEFRRDVPGCPEALVTGEPFDKADKMDFKQGDNPFSASGNCGLVSIANTLSRGGFQVSENDVTGYAISSGQCVFDPHGPASENGGTDAVMRKNILAHFGVPSRIVSPENGGNPEQIADAIDEGKGVLIGVNAGILWNNPNYVDTYLGLPASNHCISVTGAVRDANTGELKGFYIADSGRGLPEDANRYLTLEEFNDVYTNVVGSEANITTKPILEG